MLALSLGSSTKGHGAFRSPGGFPDSLLAANIHLHNLYNGRRNSKP